MNSLAVYSEKQLSTWNYPFLFGRFIHLFKTRHDTSDFKIYHSAGSELEKVADILKYRDFNQRLLLYHTLRAERSQKKDSKENESGMYDEMVDYFRERILD